jgi:hypothetical protein
VAEASYMNQEAAKKEADNMSRMIWLQEKDLEARKNDADDIIISCQREGSSKKNPYIPKRPREMLG